MPGLSASIALIVGGFLIFLTGLFFQALEKEYGAGLSWGMSTASNGASREIRPDTLTVIRDTNSGQIVFEGTYEEARAFEKRVRKERTNLFLPNLVMALGGLVVAAGVFGFAVNIRRRILTRKRTPSS
jgi:hypothetical protein